jgi:N-acetylmuramic acid 6-phosphate etherase
MEHLTTEQSNEASRQLDAMSPLEVVRLMNREDWKVVSAVEAVAGPIASAIQVIVSCVQRGGRLIYLGAGTSGRLGVLDASECPPTFNTPPELVVGIIAGGNRALTQAIEGAEDDEAAAIADLTERGLSERDCVVGIASSGRTPYVLAGLRQAQRLGAATIGVTCNASSELEGVADVVIAPVVGPEVLSGSTRLKAGTATKMVLNMLTTASMVQLGKTYGHWMVDLRASNVKLKARSVRMVSAITGLDPERSAARLVDCNGEVKVAIVSATLGLTAEQARARLERHGGRLRAALEG